MRKNEGSNENCDGRTSGDGYDDLFLGNWRDSRNLQTKNTRKKKHEKKEHKKIHKK